MGWGQIRRFLLWLFLVGGLVLYLSFGFQKPAIGMVIQEKLASGTMLYKALCSLRDRAGYAWQVVAFKEIKNGESTGVRLRLVGFPGAAEFAHPHPLQIAIDGGEVLTADDMFALSSPVPNVGQYDFAEILKQLPEKSLMLSLPLKDETFSLKIPAFVVREWQQVAASSESTALPLP